MYNVAKAYTNQLAMGEEYPELNDVIGISICDFELQHPPLLDALEAARTARFSAAEWDAYIASGMAIQNERGALSLARKEGLKGGLRRAVLDLCEVLSIVPTPDQKAALDAMDIESLSA